MNPKALARLRPVAKILAASWALRFFFDRWYFVWNWLEDAINRVFSGFPALADYVSRLISTAASIFAWTTFAGITSAIALLVLGFVARFAARARIRAGHEDPLDRLRAWTASHARATRLLLASGPVMMWLPKLVGAFHFTGMTPLRYTTLAGPVAIATFVSYFFARDGLRMLLAPTRDGAAPASTMEIGPDEIVFDAVAVTRGTKMLVGMLAALTLVVVASLATIPIEVLYRTKLPLYVIGAYVIAAIMSAVTFQRASRVAVGVDGVDVRGTSRLPFYAYRDLDEARANGSDIELVRRGLVIVRLQLHGEDAARRDAVLSRITGHIARVKEGRGATAAQLVASSSKEALARVAHGGADYRMAALTREQLWALVEGPEIEASARKAAAVALATSSDDGERARLRVAATHCAEPQVRVALEEIARGEGDEAGALGRRAAT